jgi:hypothetical protein
LLPSKIVAETLGLSGYMVKVRRKGSRNKQRLAVVARVLRIPPWLILWGPFRAAWVFFQDRTSALESAEEPLGFDPAGLQVVMVDDCVETGNSFRHVAARLEAGGAASVRTAVYCWSRMPKVPESQSRPDIYLHREIQIYPWTNNSSHIGAFPRWLEANNRELWV